MNNAELIVSILAKAGVKRGFGVPSGNVLPLMEAMRTGGIDFVLTAHEGSAGFCADVTGRLSDAPGLAIATLGPGATNLATGVGCAFLDRSPMIAITCDIDTVHIGRRVQMWIDHHTLFAPITKASWRLDSGKVAEAVTAAVALAMSEPRGPVHLDLPEDVALAAASEPVPDLRPPAALRDAADDSLRRAHELIATARRPIAIVGANAMRLQNPAMLRRFVEHLALPFATTTMAKGMIDEDHPLSLGCIERACRQMQRRLLGSADLIVGVGYDTIEVEYEAWIGAVPLVHLDIDTADVAPSVRLDHQVVGELGSTLQRLTAFAPAANGWPPDALPEHRRMFQAALRPPSKAFTPHAAIDAVRRALPRDGVLAFDVGAHTHQIGSQWTSHGPKTFLVTNGWSSMGFGLPAAIAAKLARPEQPVVCVIGDGCFQMTCGEVSVAKRARLALPIVVLDDRWLSLIRVKQMRRQMPAYGTALADEAPPEPPAHYFGVPAVAARTAAALETAVTAALAADGPTVIEAIVDAEHYAETVFD